MNKLTITAALARIKQVTGIDVTLTAPTFTVETPEYQIMWCAWPATPGLSAVAIYDAAGKTVARFNVA